jgi:hypothetical protein
MSIAIPTYEDSVNAAAPINAPARLASDVNALAPLANTYSSPQNLSYGNYVAPRDSTGNLAKFGHFIEGLGTQIGHVAEGAASWLAKTTTEMVTAPVRYGAGIAHGLADRSDINAINVQSDQLTQRLNNLHSQYSSGKIDSGQYKSALKSINSDMDNLNRQATALTTRTQNNQQDAYKATVDTSSLLLTLVTAGFGKAAATSVKGVPIEAQTTAQFLKSSAANAYLNTVERAISSAAVDSTKFLKLTSAARNALQKSVAEVVATGEKMTAGQIARASAINLALKYPIYYSMISSTGQQLYTELDQKKYGDATKTLAFNAALLLSGGPIGWAYKNLREAGAYVNAKTFGQSSFIDELSKGLFGNDSVLYEAAKGDKESIKALSALEATLVKANGNDPVAAAWKAIEGERAVDGLDAARAGKDPLEAAKAWLAHNKDWAEVQGAFDAYTKKMGLPPVAVGRWTANNANMVADQLSQLPKGQWEQAWESLKQSFPNSAFANNANLDTQIKHFIATSETPEALAANIKGIKASRYVDGFPEALARMGAKKGFLPIRPTTVEAPFVEGSGKVATKFADHTDEFFTKTVQPLPVLKTVGAMLNGAGLSPNSTTQRVYTLFNQNFTRNLQETNVFKSIKDKLGTKVENVPTASSSVFNPEELAALQKQGYTPEMIAKLEKGDLAPGAVAPVIEASTPVEKSDEQVTDYIQKRLSSYAHNPTRPGLITRTPVTDLRMLTNKDIQTALKVTRSEATEIQKAITSAHLDISTSIKGLGDRAVDLLYSTPGVNIVERRFLRTQGLLRFGANPFFQYLRVIPKTEILATAEGGGFLRTLWRGQGKELNAVRDGMRKSGLLEEKGHLGNLTGGESVDYAGVAGKNLNKRILPMQERSIAGLILDQAEKQGMDWQTYIKTYPDNARDTVQMIAEYDRNANFLNSPLARTLNVAIFPFRFDTKVLQIMTRNLAKADLFTLVAVVKGLTQADQWLKSPDGKAWYAANADAIGLFKYITPIASLNEVFHSLLPGHDHSLGNFGELGGLPFGWIPQILDNEGLTQFNQPGVDPKTGEAFTKQIPVSDRGQVAIAVQDMLGSMFSYPGATVGLPSKNKATGQAAQGLTGATAKDFKKISPTSGKEPAGNFYAAPPSASTNIPAGSIPAPITVPKPLPYKASSAKGSKGPAKKKADYRPVLLPGQSSLGQL